MKYPVLDISGPYSFILASGSPRRRELLQILGLPFTVLLPTSDTDNKTDVSGAGIDETSLPGESPPDLVQRLSRAKAQAVIARLPSTIPPEAISVTNSAGTHTAIIIAADTIVVSAGKILGKPATPSQARQMLKQLRQQKPHHVYSGLTVGVWTRQVNSGEVTRSNDLQPQTPAPPLITRLHQSKVWMRPYTDAEIEAYVASGDPLDKAGAYAIQNKTFAPVEHLEGCFASVIGLPLGELTATLGEIGLSLPAISPLCTQYTGHPCCQQ